MRLPKKMLYYVQDLAFFTHPVYIYVQGKYIFYDPLPLPPKGNVIPAQGENAIFYLSINLACLFVCLYSINVKSG